jgi:hypothetical protein
MREDSDRDATLMNQVLLEARHDTTCLRRVPPEAK